ncbi:hypothetical protein IAT40_003115 [Kwoniella sp. CBS 6097]
MSTKENQSNDSARGLSAAMEDCTLTTGTTPGTDPDIDVTEGTEGTGTAQRATSAFSRSIVTEIKPDGALSTSPSSPSRAEPNTDTGHTSATATHEVPSHVHGHRQGQGRPVDPTPTSGATSAKAESSTKKGNVTKKKESVREIIERVVENGESVCGKMRMATEKERYDTTYGTEATVNNTVTCKKPPLGFADSTCTRNFTCKYRCFDDLCERCSDAAEPWMAEAEKRMEECEKQYEQDFGKEFASNKEGDETAEGKSSWPDWMPSWRTRTTR